MSGAPDVPPPERTSITSGSTETGSTETRSTETGSTETGSTETGSTGTATDVGPSEPTGGVRALAELAAGVLAIAACTLALSTISARVPFPIEDPVAARGAFVIAFVWVGVGSLAAAALARRVGVRLLGLGVVAGTSLLVIAALDHGELDARASSLVAAALLLACSSAGAIVGMRIQHVGHLGVVALVSSVADLASVLHDEGPSAQIAQSAPTLALLAVGGPMLGTPDLPPVLGAGDLVMVSLYAAAARRFVLSERRTWSALSLGLACAMVAVIVLERALPALPFVGAAFVLAHPSARLPRVHERRTAAIGVTALVVLVTWLVTR